MGAGLIWLRTGQRRPSEMRLSGDRWDGSTERTTKRPLAEEAVTRAGRSIGRRTVLIGMTGRPQCVSAT